MTRPSLPAADLRPLRDAAREGGAGDAPLGALPEWDLDDLYPAPDAPELARDLDAARDIVATLVEEAEGRMAEMDGDALAAALGRYEDLQRLLGRVMSYAGLRHYQDTTDPTRAKFLGDMQN
ncbi:MAG TPA: oligoendopeptidase F, partial [Paracoccaceae bacterium]|nr:oligoendopeptidase F [Paracoccaceae bacterium]